MTISQSRWGMNAEVGRNPIEPRKKDRPPMAGVVGGGVLGAAGYGTYHAQKTRVRRAAGQADKDLKSLLGAREALNAHNRKVHDVGVKIREYVKPKDMRFKAAKEAAAAHSANRSAYAAMKLERPKLSGAIKHATTAVTASGERLKHVTGVARKVKPAAIAAGAIGAGLMAGSIVRGRGGERGRYSRPLRQPGMY